MPSYIDPASMPKPGLPGVAGEHPDERKRKRPTGTLFVGAQKGLPAPQEADPAVNLDAMQAQPSNTLFNSRKRQPVSKIVEQTLASGAGAPLGGSMRQPFNYADAQRQLEGQQRDPKTWQFIVGGIADALNSAGGGTPWVTRSLVAQREDNRNRVAEAAAKVAEWRWRDHGRQNEADLRAANPFTIGRSRLQLNPASGEVETLYDGAEDFELYAQELGLEPGSEEYARAVEDYVLRSSGPSAYQRNVDLDDHRTRNDADLEGLRFGNRKALETIRQGNRVSLRQTPPARAPARTPSAQMPVFRTPQEAAASGLPSGTRFRTADGKTKVIP